MWHVGTSWCVLFKLQAKTCICGFCCLSESEIEKMINTRCSSSLFLRTSPRGLSFPAGSSCRAHWEQPLSALWWVIFLRLTSFLMDNFKLQNISQLQSCILHTSYLKRPKAFLSVVSEQTAETLVVVSLSTCGESALRLGSAWLYNDHNRAA